MSQLPTLRFEDGVVPILLDAPANRPGEPSLADWMLVHRDVIKAIPRLDSLIQGSGGSHIPSLRLIPQGRTFDLASRVRDLHRRVYASKILSDTRVTQTTRPAPIQPPMHAFDEMLHAGALQRRCRVTPRPYEPRVLKRQTAVAIRALFAILYGHEITIQMLQYQQNVNSPPNNLLELQMARATISLIAGFAESWDVLSVVAPVLSRILLQHPKLGEGIVKEPERFVLLGELLRCSTLYYDSLRCLVGMLIMPQNWSRIRNVLQIPDSKALEIFRPRVIELTERVEELKENFWALTLRHLFENLSTTLKRPKEFAYEHIQTVGRKDTSHPLTASTIFVKGDLLPAWLTFYQNDPAAAVAQIEQPTAEKTLFFTLPSTSAMILQRYGAEIPEPVTDAMAGVVREARGVIERIFAAKIVRVGQDMLTYRRATEDSTWPFFSYLGLDESRRPWDRMESWRGFPSLEGLRRDPASLAREREWFVRG